jgi:pimeloyl-[acyl-carrier protein] synthase
VATAAALSLTQLFDPRVLADPYPLYRRMREQDPVYWDPFLHKWIVTRYADVIHVLHHFSAVRGATPEQLRALGCEELGPAVTIMLRQMLFHDAPSHTRIRGLAAAAFTPARVAVLRGHIQEIADGLIDRFRDRERIDLVRDFAEPLPAIVSSELLGVPVEDHLQLKSWSADFADMLGNFQHNPERTARVLQSVHGMDEYFRERIREQRKTPREGLIHSFLTAEVEGTRFSEDEVIANVILTMVGGQETTTNLIGNGMLTLMRQPEAMRKLRARPEIIQTAVEELLRYESPSQHTARIAPGDVELGGKKIRNKQGVVAVMAAGNRDPERFADPDKLDLERQDNRHLAFGWAAHFCFGAPLARLEGQIAFSTLLRRFSDFALEPEPLEWRPNLGLRGLRALPVRVQLANPDPQ